MKEGGREEPKRKRTVGGKEKGGNREVVGRRRSFICGSTLDSAPDGACKGTPSKWDREETRRNESRGAYPSTHVQVRIEERGEVEDEVG